MRAVKRRIKALETLMKLLLIAAGKMNLKPAPQRRRSRRRVTMHPIGLSRASAYVAHMDIRITRVQAELPAAFEPLRAAASAEGFSFLDRLALRWRAGAYDGDARAGVSIAVIGDELAAIGAQTIDEYDPHPQHRRLRHFYVAPQWRRFGVGGALASALTAEAFAVAPRLHLRTAHAVSMAFWDAMGFARVARANRTHEKVRP